MIDTLSIAMSKIKHSMEGLMKGLGCRVESLEKDLVEPLEEVMGALESRDAGLDGKAGLHGGFHRAEAGEAGKILVGTVRVHGRSLFVNRLRQRRENSIAKLTAACQTVTRLARWIPRRDSVCR